MGNLDTSKTIGFDSNVKGGYEEVDEGDDGAPKDHLCNHHTHPDHRDHPYHHHPDNLDHYDQVTAPTPSLGSHGSGEGDSTYFTGERPSPHHLSVLSEFPFFLLYFSHFFKTFFFKSRTPPQCAQ